MLNIVEPKVRIIEFSNGKQAKILETLPTISAQQAINPLELPATRFNIVLHVGASDLLQKTHDNMVHMLQASLMRYAQDNQAMVVDGGTDAGFMRVMGEAYTRFGGSFPLIGVTVSKAVTYPGGPPPEEGRWALSADHSHFVVVDAEDFGTESHLLVSMAKVNGNYGVALAINGGEIVRSEIEMHAQLGTPIIVLKGTGRYADALANADEKDAIRRPFVQSAARLEVFDINSQPPEDLYHLIRRVLLF